MPETPRVRVGPLVVDLGDLAAEADQEGENAPYWHEETSRGVEEVILRAIEEVSDDTTKTVQTYRHVVHHETSVMDKLRFGLETMRPGANPEQCDGTEHS